MRFKRHFLYFSLCPLPLLLSLELLGRFCLCLPYCFPTLAYTQWWNPSWAFFSWSRTISALLASPDMSDASVSWLFKWPFAESFSGPCQNWNHYSRYTSPMLRRGEGSLPSTCWLLLSNPGCFQFFILPPGHITGSWPEIIVHQDPKVFLRKTAFHLLNLQPVLLHGITSPCRQDLAFSLVQLHEISDNPFL